MGFARNAQNVHFESMHDVSMTEVRRQTRQVSRALDRGESVGLTAHGQVIGRIVPELPRVVLSLEEFRALEVTDAAILRAIEEARE